MLCIPRACSVMICSRSCCSLSACASAPYPRCQQRAVKQFIRMSPVLLEGAHHRHESADEYSSMLQSPIAPPEQSVPVLSCYLECVSVSWLSGFFC